MSGTSATPGDPSSGTPTIRRPRDTAGVEGRSAQPAVIRLHAADGGESRPREPAVRGRCPLGPLRSAVRDQGSGGNAGRSGRTPGPCLQVEVVGQRGERGHGGAAPPGTTRGRRPARGHVPGRPAGRSAAAITTPTSATDDSDHPHDPHRTGGRCSGRWSQPPASGRARRRRRARAGPGPRPAPSVRRRGRRRRTGGPRCAAPPPGRRRPAWPGPRRRTADSPAPAPPGSRSAGSPARAVRLISFAASATAGWPSGTPSTLESRCFSARLSSSQRCSWRSAVSIRSVPANTCGWRPTSLATRSAATSSMSNRPLRRAPLAPSKPPARGTAPAAARRRAPRAPPHRRRPRSPGRARSTPPPGTAAATRGSARRPTGSRRASAAGPSRPRRRAGRPPGARRSLVRSRGPAARSVVSSTQSVPDGRVRHRARGERDLLRDRRVGERPGPWPAAPAARRPAAPHRRRAGRRRCAASAHERQDRAALLVRRDHAHRDRVPHAEARVDPHPHLLGERLQEPLADRGEVRVAQRRRGVGIGVRVILAGPSRAARSSRPAAGWAGSRRSARSAARTARSTRPPGCEQPGRTCCAGTSRGSARRARPPPGPPAASTRALAAASSRVSAAMRSAVTVSPGTIRCACRIAMIRSGPARGWRAGRRATATAPRRRHRSAAAPRRRPHR